MADRNQSRRSDDHEAETRIPRGSGEVPGEARFGREKAEEINRDLDIAHALITGDMSLFNNDEGDYDDTSTGNR